MIELTPEQDLKVQNWLREKGVKKCPICNNKEQLFRYYRGQVEISYTDKYDLNAVQLTCSNCCHVMLFELPLILKEMEIQQQVESEQ